MFFLDVSANISKNLKIVRLKQSISIDLKCRKIQHLCSTVVVRAIASGEDLHYKWQKNKGSLVPKPEEENVAYFWGCTTCTGWLTISCTVYNAHGAYTKEVEVYVLREWKR